MKRLLLIVLPLLLIVGCSQKPVDETTLIEKDGVMYLPNSDKPYTGEVFINYDTGEKLYQGTYENGLLVQYSYLNKDGSVIEPINFETSLVERDGVFYTKDTNKPYSGPAFSLDEDGRNKRESILEDGKMISYKDLEWYSNGLKKWEGTWKDGERDGLWTGWYNNGLKEWEGTWKDGERDGLWTWYYENGNKYREKDFYKWNNHKYEFNGNNTFEIGWYRNGVKAYENKLVKSNSRMKHSLYWDENGKRISSDDFRYHWREQDYRGGKYVGDVYRFIDDYEFEVYLGNEPSFIF